MEVRDAVLTSLREYDMLSGADRVICALSGGADSICLADVLLSLASELGFRLECAHFDHLLRGAESQRDAAFVSDWCHKRGLRLHTGSGDAAAYAAESRIGIEEAARTLRYAFLDSLGDAHTRIATAHQADDQAETMLLNLLRGSGLKGLGGIPPVRGIYIRPMLNVDRQTVLTYLQKHGLEHVEDSTNRDTLYHRNKLRHEVMPVLREMNPAISTLCSRTAKLLREDEALLDELAGKAVTMEGEKAVLSISELLSLPGPLRSRALRRSLGAFGVQPEEKHIAALLELARTENPSAQLDLPGGIRAWRQYDKMMIARQEKSLPLPETKLTCGQWTDISGTKLCVFWGDKPEPAKIHGKFTTFFFKKDKICGNITVRSRREGDHLALPGRQGKSLKKWMIQEKFPASERDRVPVFADEVGVLAVWGLGADERAAALPEAADSVLVILERT